MGMKQQRPISRDQALQLMGGLCAKSEQCEYDLRTKLVRKNLSAVDIEYIINYLYDHNFLNEERFARAYVRDKYRFNQWGRIKLRMMLKAKRVQDDAINKALEAIDTDEYLEILRGVVKSKSRSLDVSTQEGRQKLLRSIYSRGYEPALIIPEIKRLAAK